MSGLKWHSQIVAVGLITLAMIGCQKEDSIKVRDTEVKSASENPKTSEAAAPVAPSPRDPPKSDASSDASTTGSSGAGTSASPQGKTPLPPDSEGASANPTGGTKR